MKKEFFNIRRPPKKLGGQGNRKTKCKKSAQIPLFFFKKSLRSQEFFPTTFDQEMNPNG